MVSREGKCPAGLFDGEKCPAGLGVGKSAPQSNDSLNSASRVRRGGKVSRRVRIRGEKCPAG